MSTFSQFTSRLDNTLGDIKYKLSAAGAIETDPFGAEWIRSGTVVSYASKYSPLITKSPGLIISSLPTATSTSTFNYLENRYYGGAKMFTQQEVGRNVVVGGYAASTNNWLACYYSNTNSLTYSNNSSGQLSNFLLQIGGVFRHSNTTTLVAHGYGSGQYGVGYSTDGGINWTQSTSGLTTDRRFYFGVGGLSNSMIWDNLNTVYTSSNGTSWTSRTISGGHSGSNDYNNYMSMHYCPVGSCYLYAMTNGRMNKTTDGYTLSTVTLPSGMPSFMNEGGYSNFERYYASSPTASVWILSDGRLLRTTDGTNFSLIDLVSQGLPKLGSGASPTSTTSIAYNSANSRFIIHTGVTAGDPEPSYYYSDDNGATWSVSLVIQDTSNISSLPNLATWKMGMAYDGTNSKFMAFCGTGSVANRLYDLTSFNYTNPSYVGTTKIIYGHYVSASAIPYGYVKIKE